MDRTRDFVGLHPIDQRGCDRSLQPGEGGCACGGAGTEPRRLSDHSQRPINNSIDVFWKGRRKRSPSLFAAPKATTPPPHRAHVSPRREISGARFFRRAVYLITLI